MGENKEVLLRSMLVEVYKKENKEGGRSRDGRGGPGEVPFGVPRFGGGEVGPRRGRVGEVPRDILSNPGLQVKGSFWTFQECLGEGGFVRTGYF